jgi:hypothetical protein
MAMRLLASRFVAWALLAVASCAEVAVLEDSGAAALAGLRGVLEKVTKERDDAVAQMAAMKTALAQKCGQSTADIAEEKAKLASAKMAEARGAAQVKADQAAAKREAEAANRAMATARAAVAAKEKAKASLTDANKQMKAAQAKVSALDKQAAAAREEAKQIAEGNNPDDEVKAAYAKASSLYAAQMDAKMRLEMTQKRVTELGGKVDSASTKANQELLNAKGFTNDAAAKVKLAMNTQVNAAKEKRLLAEKEARVVKEQESQLLKESNTIQKKLNAAKAKSVEASDAVDLAKLHESRALEAIKLPAGASPEEQQAFEQAKFKVMAEVNGGTANYAQKIKQIEERLLSAKRKVRQAKTKVEELTSQKQTLMSKSAAESDSLVKAKMQNQIKGLDGAIAEKEQVAKDALKEMDKIAKEQQAQIKSVVDDVVLSQDTATSNDNAEAADEAKEYMASTVNLSP